jgi:hypothetical protein
VKTLLLYASIALMIGSASAAPVLCPSAGTIQTLINLSGAGGGCLINGVLFNNFSFSPSATGTGLLPSASQVSYTLDNPSLSTANGQLIYGFEFNPNLAVLGVGSQDILLNYSIMAQTPIITSIHLLMNAATTGTATAVVSEGPNRACIISVCSFLPLLQVTPGSPHQELVNIGPFSQIDVFKDIQVVSISPSGFASLSQVRDSVDLLIPEPASALLAMLGVLLIGVARLVQRRTSARSSGILRGDAQVRSGAGS